ncbi:MAG: SUMF1/EgtB/PvdO family nonheme iron enzyme, partial [Candidatus Eremiobacteraeota bacterium]|nr:SUMF1/EgtB/PvdO family nonheme iron enzyme [Candidatus Eremiobacteraeota bacterium]
LETYLEAHGPLSPERVVKIAHQLLDVLEFLHTSDPPVVYRDLKPANIILGPEDKVTLVDFGLATAPAAATGTAIGTEGYCPLEQYQGKAEPRSDLYALGATMLCLLTGVAPTPLQYPGAPALDSILRKAMALQLEDRFVDAAAFRRALAGEEQVVAVAADGAEMVLICGGTFRLGRSDDPDYSSPREVQLEQFWIDRLPVSNARFRAFVDATGYRVEGSWPEWKGDRADYPAVGLSWNDARAYCAWAGKRLPEEDEWERAATGPAPRKYPFGDEWDPAACGHGTSRGVPMLDLVNGRGPTPVGHFPTGASPEGCLDMAGNVWEWTATAEGQGRVVKGGCWANRDPRTLACAARLSFAPESHDARRGFRGVSSTRPE